jgi:hypothetical protein
MLIAYYSVLGTIYLVFVILVFEIFLMPVLII